MKLIVIRGLNLKKYGINLKVAISAKLSVFQAVSVLLIAM